MSIITYSNYYVPDEKLSIDDFLYQIKENEIPSNFESKNDYKDFITEILQLGSIRIETRQTQEQMVCGLIDKAIEENAFKPKDIDLIIVAQENYTPTTQNIGHYVQSKYKMINAYPINISGNQCINIEIAIINALKIQNASSTNCNVLIISSSKKTNPTNRIFNSYAVCGDGAGIMLIQKENTKGIRIIDHEIVCNGALAASNFEGNSMAHCNYSLKSIQELIKRNSSIEKVSKIIIQNANPLLATQCLLSQGFSEESIFTYNLGKYGHLDQLDFLVNLHDCLRSSDSVEKILSFGFGSAGSYITMLFSKQ